MLKNTLRKIYPVFCLFFVFFSCKKEYNKNAFNSVFNIDIEKITDINDKEVKIIGKTITLSENKIELSLQDSISYRYKIYFKLNNEVNISPSSGSVVSLTSTNMVFYTVSFGDKIIPYAIYKWC